jgi:hypothetical protein
VSDPSFNSVSLLLHCDGSNGSTTFVDSSGTPKTVTANSGAVVSTAAPKFGTGAAQFVNTSSHLLVPYSAEFGLAAADITIEFWAQGAQRNRSAASFRTSGGAEAWNFEVNSSGFVVFTALRSDGFSYTLTQTAGDRIAENNGVWYHVALSKDSSTIRLFVSGVQRASAAIGTSLATPNTSHRLIIGAESAVAWDGFLDDIRITTGVARYTADFTPPTAAFPDSLPPLEGFVQATGPLGVPALVARQQYGSLAAPGPLGAASIIAAQYYASIAAAGPLGAPALLAHQQFASVQATGPLGTPQVLGAQQTASIIATGPLGVARILATFPVVATVTATGPLGSPAVLAWHDFTTSLTGQEISRYVMDLITPSGVVRVPISSWQATLQTDASSFVQCVVPAASEYIDHIVAATSFVITRLATLPGGQVISYEMASSPLEQIAPSQGPTNYTVVLSGYPPALTANDNPPDVQDRTLSGVRSVAGLAGSMRVRCSIDWLLRPGMRAYQAETPILVDYINYYVNTSDQYMDVGERA